MKQFAYTYRALLRVLLSDGVEEKNERTGAAIKILEGGGSFQLDLSDGYLPTCGLRKTWPHVAAAELVWCLRGDDHIDWLRKHTKVWDQFADKYYPLDEHQGPNYLLDAAYGYRWRHKFERDQLALAVEALQKNPTDRRIWISSWDPAVDGLGAPDQKTVPCPVGFTFSIVSGKLHSTFVLRSSDVFMGLPHDVMRHALLMASVAADLKVWLGTMQVTLAHPHLYDKHWDLARKCLDEVMVCPPIILPKYTACEILTMEDVYVTEMKETAAALAWPTYSPKVEVIA